MGEKKEKKKKDKKEKKDKEKKEEKATVRSAPDGSDNKSFQPDFKSGFFALLSRFSSSLAHHSDTNLFSQPRRCEHHRQQSGGASEWPARSPWLRGHRGGAGQAGAGQVHPGRARACRCLARWQHFCSALHRLNCDCSTLVFICSEQLAVLSIDRSYLPEMEKRNKIAQTQVLDLKIAQKTRNLRHIIIHAKTA